MEHISRALSSPGLTREPDRISVDEIKARVRQCARLFAAWPNARPASLDLALVEYVNATRGVPIDRLPALIQQVIDAGGEFIPPAGAIVHRVAKARAAGRRYDYNPWMDGEQLRREHEEREARAMCEAARDIAPLGIEDVATAVRAIEAGTGRAVPRLIGGSR